ncbi:hypothetical protein WICPIJ_002128 [Wickerhamomyces pijperi]|uniref:37S ribosomal protein YMR-31, mitochondrial n=1 Tax=Wickerhamomyces pijperi TaxID=599730 RepID=A0A9P8Q9J7_WICPI|nr:hypothetical protein WICPIJ_002128 [Wickerhamomyces pijperi]
MRATSVLKATQRTPLIKFIGGKHHFETIDNSIVAAHPDSHGLLPGSPDAIKVSSLPKPKPVIPQVKKQVSILKPNDKPYDFIAVSQLPKRFQNPVFYDAEMDVINAGGAY